MKNTRVVDVVGLVGGTLTYKTGTIGPAHDPYSVDEYVFASRNAMVHWRYGVSGLGDVFTWNDGAGTSVTFTSHDVAKMDEAIKHYTGHTGQEWLAVVHVHKERAMLARMGRKVYADYRTAPLCDARMYQYAV